MSWPYEELNWDRVLTNEYWSIPYEVDAIDRKEGFLNGRAQNIAAGLYGDTLILVVGWRATDHSRILHSSHLHFSRKVVDLPDDPAWTGGAFIEYQNQEDELNIWGASSTLDGPLTPEVEKLVLETFSGLEFGSRRITNLARPWL